MVVAVSMALGSCFRNETSCKTFDRTKFYDMAAEYIKINRDSAGLFRGYHKAEIHLDEVRSPSTDMELLYELAAVLPIHVDNGPIALEISQDCSIEVNEYSRGDGWSPN